MRTVLLMTMVLIASTAGADPLPSCAERAQALRARLLADGQVLGMAHPDVALEVGTVDLTRADLPLFVQRIDGRRLTLSAESQVSVAHGPPMALHDPRLVEVLTEPRGTSETSFVELERWDPQVRETFDRHYELIDHGTAVIVDRAVPSRDVARLMETLATAGWTEIDLLVLAEQPPTVRPGFPHPDGDGALWFGHWPRWLSPPAALTEDLDHPPGEDVLALAPWRLRPLIFAELAAEAYARDHCPVDEAQVVWWHQLQFPPPRHAVARLSLTHTDAVHRRVTLDGDASWGESMERVTAALGEDLTGSPGERLDAWFVEGETFEVIRAVPEAWAGIPHYAPLTPDLAAHVTRHPDQFRVESAAPPVILGSLDPTHIDGVVGQHLDALRSCHQYALRDGVTVHGGAVVDLVLEPVGRVARATLNDSSVGHAATEQCITETFAHMRFPGPLVGLVMVSYPILYDGPAP
jgi:hypothetical protein